MTEKVCTCCKELKPVSEFSPRVLPVSKKLSYYSRCRKCNNLNDKRRKGVIEKRRELKKQGLRYCSKCDSIKPINKYPCYCKECNNKISQEYRKTEKGKLKRFIQNFKDYNGFINEDVVEIIKLKKELKKYLIIKFDNLEFFDKVQFAKYLFEKYNIPKFRTISRIKRYNCSPQECLLTEKEFRESRKNIIYKYKTIDEKGNILLFESKLQIRKQLKIPYNMLEKCIKENIKTYNYFKTKANPIYKIEKL